MLIISSSESTLRARIGSAVVALPLPGASGAAGCVARGILDGPREKM
jgi:hypothetical protein